MDDAGLKETPRDQERDDVIPEFPKHEAGTLIQPNEPLPQLEAKYLLIGAGTASFSALKVIKERDPLAKVCSAF